jgi:TRAP-type C4-dicarboxylate transport system permease small subunit
MAGLLGSSFRQWQRRLNGWGASVAGLALLAMVLIGAIDVVLGRGLNLSVAGAREITEILMVAAALMGMALSQQRREHVRVTLLTDRLPQTARRWLDRLGLLLTLLLMMAISGYGFQSAFQSFQSGEFSPGSLAVPIWPAKLALGLGALLMALESLTQVVGGQDPSEENGPEHHGPY